MTPLARTCHTGRGSVGRRGWRGEEEDLIAGVADAWGPVGSGCGSGASRRGEAVRAGRWDPAIGVCARGGGEAKLDRLRGPRARVGGQAGWLARPSRPGLLLLPILSFLFFYSFSILFSFLFYLLPICLGFDLFSLIIIVTIPSFWFGQEFRAYMWSPHT